MITFDLECANGHSFEGWFEDGKAYESQHAGGLITCPVCSDMAIRKKPTTFGIKSSPKMESRGTAKPELEKISRQLVEYVEKNFDHVGANFAKEALKIHYGVSEPRNIRGYSTGKEEKELIEEGVKFFKFPLPVPQDSDS